MAENLQHLLDKIQKDGVDKAEAEAQAIVAKARQQAADLLREAAEQKEQILTRAARDAELFAERGRKALQQAARDVVLTVGAATQNAMQGIVDSQVAKAITPDVLKQMIVKVVEAYCSDPSHGLDISVAEQDREQIVSYFMNELKGAIHNGCTVRSDGRIPAGFRASVNKGHVSHDFTAEAIGEAMAKLLRPQLAEITRAAVAGMAKSAEKKA